MGDAEGASEYNPFFNVRKGGPKEARIKRVELMGEHKPKPTFYVKVEQSLDDDLLPNESIVAFFEARIGKVGDIYRPVDEQSFAKEFALVGFHSPEHCDLAVRCLRQERTINLIPVTGEIAKQWLLDLYPKSQ